MARTPTNTALDKKLDAVLDEVKDMNVILLRHDKSIGELMQDKKLEAYGRKLIENYKKQEAEEKQNQTRDGIATYQLKAWHLIVGILAILSAILYAVAATKGLKP